MGVVPVGSLPQASVVSLTGGWEPRGSYRTVEFLDRGRGLFKIFVGKAKDRKIRLVERFDGLKLVHSENGSLDDVIH